jgi:hypothetical protein
MGASKYTKKFTGMEDHKLQAPSQKVKKATKKLPHDVIVRIHAKSSSGGRGYCVICKTSYSMNFMNLCHLGFAKPQDLVCKDCQKLHGIKRV